MKETGPTGRAEEIVESKIESWIPISYAVRQKGRHSSLPLSLPPPFWFLLLRRRPREFIMFLARHSLSHPRPPNSLSALCPLRLPELCNFGTTPMVRLAEVALGDGVDDDKVGGLYSVLAAEVATKGTATGESTGVSLVSCRILRQHRVLGMAVADKHDNDDDMHAVGRGGMCSVRVGGCLDERGKEGLANTE